MKNKKKIEEVFLRRETFYTRKNLSKILIIKKKKKKNKKFVIILFTEEEK